MPSSRIVACDQDITRINSTAPESEGIRLRKVEAAARGLDLGQGDVKGSSELPARPSAGQRRITSVATTAESRHADAPAEPRKRKLRNILDEQGLTWLTRNEASQVLRVMSNPLVYPS
jgi:hypothetical protein